jgi:cellulose synthase operon protein C
MLNGLSHYGLQQFEKAKPYFELVLGSSPAAPVAKLLAQIHLKDKNLDRAISALDSYLRAHPGDGQAVMLLASAHMAQGRHARATQLTQDVLKLGDNASLRTTLGMSLLGGGKLANAVPELEAALKKDPGQLQAGSALVTIYLQSGQARRAVGLAESLIKQAPRNPGMFNLLGVARHAAGDSEGARTALLQAVALDPSYMAPQIQLARIDLDKQAPEAAVARLNAVLSTEPRNLEAMLALATAAESRKRLPEAQQWLEKADDLSGLDNSQAALALVDMHLRQSQFELAREATKRLLTKAPEALPTLLAVARVSLANNDAAGARIPLTRAASLASYDAPLLVKIGHAAACRPITWRALPTPWTRRWPSAPT